VHLDTIAPLICVSLRVGGYFDLGKNLVYTNYTTLHYTGARNRWGGFALWLSWPET
jgi:hypothetical protein